MKNLDLTKDNINKLLLALSIPSIISLLTNSVYNIVDQIFIGHYVGILGNAATNIIFPLILMFSALAILIGEGTCTELLLKLKMKEEDDAKKVIGSSISIVFFISIIVTILAYLFLPKLIYLFGASSNVYSYALDYGRIIVLSAPFMMLYTTLTPIIRADGSFKYAIFMLVSGVIINIVFDAIFILGLNMGIKGCALATIIGQFFSFILALFYIPKIKSVKLKSEDFKPNKSIIHIISLGLYSFMNQIIISILFIFVNNTMVLFGSSSKYGIDIPLAAYGGIAKINYLFILIILGFTISAQSIIGFNYGAGNYERVKITLNKVLKINFIIGIILNILLIVFPEQLINIFLTKVDPNYHLFVEFSTLVCRVFFMVCSLNFLEIITGVVTYSMGKVKKTIVVLLIRPIIILCITLFLCIILNKGIYGVLYAGALTDIICFVICFFLFLLEYNNLICVKDNTITKNDYNINNILYSGKRMVITISREYGSGGHYVGKLLAEKLGIKFYDKNLIRLVSQESGLSEWYVEETEQRLSSGKFPNNNDDRLFSAEAEIIKKLANKESCVIVGRCADYILKDDPNTIKIFLYSDQESKINRVILYYNVNSKEALKTIFKINYERAKHYKYYTTRDWKDINNYDLMLNVDQLGIELVVEYIINYIEIKKISCGKRRF